MNRKRIFTKFVPLVLLLTMAGNVVAQGPELPGEASVQASLGTVFTYQGRLTDGGQPANGLYDFRFKLFNAEAMGGQVGTTVIKDNVSVSNGFFTVQLDFGDVFSGTALWLEIGVRPGASTGAYTILAPRQAITASPYALYAMHAAWSGLTGIPAGFADNVDNDAGGDITAVYAGTGLSGGGTSGDVTLNADTNYLQRRVSGACATGSAIRSINTDGTVTCESDDNTTYSAGTGLRLSGNQFSLLPSYQLPQTCANGQVAQWNGSAWTCAAAGSNGDITAVYAGTGLSGGGTSGDVTLNVNFAGSGSANTAARSDHKHWGASWSGSGTGLELHSSDEGPALFAIAVSGDGVRAQSQSGAALSGSSTRGTGVEGFTTADGTEDNGVAGWNFGCSGCGSGVYGYSDYSYGVFADSDNYVAIYANGGGTSGIAALRARNWRGGVIIDAYGINQYDREFYVSNTGEVYADGSFHSGGADFAEMWSAAEGLEPGDVLVIGPDGKLYRSTQPYQSTVVGVYSTKPALLGGHSDDSDSSGEVPLAVVGIVLVKASAENGPIRPGDLLVCSSIAGHAMKASANPPPGTVIGKALEGLNEDTGVIRMLVMLR